MKISGLIKQLKEIQTKKGDLTVFTPEVKGDGRNPAYVSTLEYDVRATASLKNGLILRIG